MKVLIKKELFSFLASPIGYVAIGVFLIVNGLFLWILKNDFNILQAGFADLNSFFYLIPWVFLMLIPAVTMKMIADEYRLGTMEVLLSKPITTWQLIFGKYIAALILILISLAFTLVYIISIYYLANPIGNIDLGVIIGSYLGLLFLASAYISIGLYTSSLSQNQLIAFILGMLLSYFLFYGFEFIAEILSIENINIQTFGLFYHFKSISKGVIDSRDIIYFISVTFFFLYLTKINISDE